MSSLIKKISALNTVRLQRHTDIHTCPSLLANTLFTIKNKAFYGFIYTYIIKTTTNTTQWSKWKNKAKFFTLRDWITIQVIIYCHLTKTTTRIFIYAGDGCKRQQISVRFEWKYACSSEVYVPYIISSVSVYSVTVFVHECSVVLILKGRLPVMHTYIVHALFLHYRSSSFFPRVWYMMKIEST